MSSPLNKQAVKAITDLAAKFIHTGEGDSDARFHAFVFSLRAVSLVYAEQFQRHGGTILHVDRNGTGIASELRETIPDVRTAKPAPAPVPAPEPAVMVAPVSVKVTEPAVVSAPVKPVAVPKKK